MTCVSIHGAAFRFLMDRLRLSSIQLRKKGPEMPEREEEEDEGKDGTPLPASHRLMCIRDTCNVLSE